MFPSYSTATAHVAALFKHSKQHGFIERLGKVLHEIKQYSYDVVQCVPRPLLQTLHPTTAVETKCCWQVLNRYYETGPHYTFTGSL